MRKEWRRLTKQYEIESLRNGRAFYRWRCVVSEEEKDYKIEFQKDVDKEEEKDIIKLSEISKTLVNFENHLQKWISNPKNHKFNKDTEIKIEKHYKKLIDENSFGMRVKYSSLKQIIKDNCFKNQLETNTSGGVLDLQGRKEISEFLFGTDISNAENKDFEKYGYLCDGNPKLDFDNNKLVNQYGNVCVRFKKDKIKRCTTFTSGDSLDEIRVYGNNYRPSSVENPSFSSEVDPYVKYQDNDDLLKHLNKASKPYIELQYHGKITLDDVESVSIDCFNYIAKDINDIAEMISGKGIKVYRTTEMNYERVLEEYDKDTKKWIYIK